MKTIRINAIQFAEMCDHEHSKLLICDERSFFLGERVILQVFSVNDNQPTGAMIKRFIKDIEYLSTSRDEDTYMYFHLSALNPYFYCKA